MSTPATPTYPRKWMTMKIFSNCKYDEYKCLVFILWFEDVEFEYVFIVEKNYYLFLKNTHWVMVTKEVREPSLV